MPPQNQPNANPVQPVPERNDLSNIPERQSAPQAPETRPETAPQPLSQEKPAAEIFSDQAPTQAPTQVPAQTDPQDPVVVEPVSTTAPILPISEDDEAATDIPVIDKEWIQAADAVIEENKEEPYKEEERSEDLQIKYLKTRFGRDLKKSE
jgi:hypothetical protein